MSETAGRMIDQALAYARRGLRVLPIRLGDKTPLVAHGVLDASCDEATIRARWTRWPAANIAIAVPQTWTVVDVDPRNGGDASLAQLVAEHGPMPSTVTARTGGGGAHYVYRRPAGVTLRGKLAPGIDLLGLGRYILAAPSIHPSGKTYAWTSPKGTNLAPAPAWLIELAREREIPPPRPWNRPRTPVATGAEHGDSYDHRLDRASKYLAAMPGALSGSGGHATTFRAAVAMVRGFALEPDDALGLLVEVHNPQCAPPWSLAELKHKVKSAATRARLEHGWLADRPLRRTA